MTFFGNDFHLQGYLADGGAHPHVDAREVAVLDGEGTVVADVAQTVVALGGAEAVHLDGADGH